MRAVRMGAFGEPSILRVEEMPDLVAREGYAVLSITAASINPSDVKNVAGAFADTTLPRTPGRDFAGVVIDGPPEWLGARVFGSGGDLGFTVDGTHASQLLVPIAALVRTPDALSDEQAASIGVTSVVAWLGLVEFAVLAPGETVAIVGAGGGVGTAAAQIARARGASLVIGVDRFEPDSSSIVASAIDDFIRADGDLVETLRARTNGVGVHVVYDAVGGVMFEPSLRSLAHAGRLIEISATGTSRVSFDARDFYHNESRILGADSRKLDVTQTAHRLRAMLPLFERGALVASSIGDVVGLDSAIEAYGRVADGSHGRTILRP